MSLPEQKFNRWLSEQIEGHFTRIENSTIGGVPDIHVCWQGTSIWIESKVLVDGRVLLRPAQHAWGFKYSANGGLAYVIALHEETEQILVWQHPVKVEPYSKYVNVTSVPKYAWTRRDFRALWPRLFNIS
jgi:hypothetical protein